MFRPTKRQRMDHPSSWMDCEVLTAVPSLPRGKCQPSSASFSFTTKNVSHSESGPKLTTHTPLASAHIKDLFLDRFQNEIVDRFQFTLTSSVLADKNGDYVRQQLKQMIQIGTNSSTRALQRAGENQAQQQGVVPRLVVCAAEDVSPVTPLVHIPALSEKLQVPLLLLPGRASFELGKRLKANKVSVITFMTRNENAVSNQLSDAISRDVDSFVDFIVEKAGIGW